MKKIVVSYVNSDGEEKIMMEDSLENVFQETILTIIENAKLQKQLKKAHKLCDQLKVMVLKLNKQNKYLKRFKDYVKNIISRINFQG